MRKIRPYILFTISIFCVAIISFILYNLFTSDNQPTAKRAGNSKKQNTGNGAVMEINTTQRHDFVYPSDNIRDPFLTGQRIVTKQEMPSLPIQTDKPLSLKLTGVIWKDGKGIAIIKDSNNQTHLAKSGEEIDSVKVIEIKPRMVKVQMGNEVIDLMLWPEAKM